MSELSNGGETRADTRSHRTAKAAVRVVGDVVCVMGDS